MAEPRDSNFSRDLLQRFMCGGRGTPFPVNSKEEAPKHGRRENVDLSLGLSLNGRFGVEPQRMLANDDTNNNKLFHASSVTDFVNIPVDMELSLYPPLTRTCSLPPETESELRKRKELQSLRRSEAKRKRVEKLKNVRVVKGKTGEDWDANTKNMVNGVELWGGGLKPPSPSPSPSPSPLQQFSSQGSIGSQGSSGVSDLDSQPFPGINKDTSEWRSRTRSNDQAAMPFVSTRGDGPGGEKIQGFLYRYGKGEDVRIVCVCHGSFLTPAEFVKHGGGGEVDHPLRHIIVNSFFL